jgi:hypothetical protein
MLASPQHLTVKDDKGSRFGGTTPLVLYMLVAADV